MASEAEMAAFRMMLRKMAPNLKKTFEDRARSWGEPVQMLYMTLRYKPGSDMADHKNVMIDFNSIMTKKQISATNDPNHKLDADQKILLEEAFPVGAELIKDQAVIWGVSPYDLFMMIRIKAPGEDIDDPETTEIQIRTHDKITPARGIVVQ